MLVFHEGRKPEYPEEKTLGEAKRLRTNTLDAHAKKSLTTNTERISGRHKSLLPKPPR